MPTDITEDAAVEGIRTLVGTPTEAGTYVVTFTARTVAVDKPEID